MEEPIEETAEQVSKKMFIVILVTLGLYVASVIFFVL